MSRYLLPVVRMKYENLQKILQMLCENKREIITDSERMVSFKKKAKNGKTLEF
jgi:hypothetical protein